MVPGEYMDLIDGLKTRRSIRKYQDKPVPDSTIEDILDIARFAPSANNNQPWQFVVIKDPDRKSQLRGGIRDAFFSFSTHILEAPVVLAAWYTPSFLLKQYQPYDVANCVTYVLLAAHAKGLGTCWIGWFSEDRVKTVLSLPKKAKVAALITLGYPKETPEPRDRNPVKDFVYREVYTQPW
jgi:nitroreductase